MLAAFIWARRVSHRQKRSGSRTRDSKARIFSLAFPVTLWKPRNPLRRMARTIFFWPRLRHAVKSGIRLAARPSAANGSLPRSLCSGTGHRWNYVGERFRLSCRRGIGDRRHSPFPGCSGLVLCCSLARRADRLISAPSAGGEAVSARRDRHRERPRHRVVAIPLRRVPCATPWS